MSTPSPGDSASATAHVSSGGAAVLFDPSLRTFSVLTDNVDSIEREGEVVHHHGQLKHVIALCESVAAAKEECKDRATALLPMMKASVEDKQVHGDDENDDSISDEFLNGFEDDSHAAAARHTPVPEEQLETGVVDESRYREESESGQIDYEATDAIRNILETMFEELNRDVDRINDRQRVMRSLIDHHLGGRAAPGVLESKPRPPARLLPSATSSRSLPPPEQPLRSRSPTAEDDIVPPPVWKPKRPKYPPSDDDEDWEGEMALVPKSRGAPPLKKLNGNRLPTYPSLESYPFISREEEIDCIVRANGSASSYAQRLAKLLFKESLHLYFKDQDAKKRQWIHAAVDARFPSEDRQAQATKWKNCSGAINKNRQCDEPSVDTGRQIDYSYVARDEEQQAFDNCHQDPTKYAELLGMKLFEGTLDRMFRDQDAVKKEWLRECVDIRFPCDDKVKRDGRWKVCASAVNRNRNKYIGNDGEAIAYPYISQAEEERCLAVAKDNVGLYAELLGRLLFKNTRHLMFKDQDPRVRQWVHDIIDRRYPTPDRAKHAAKWKTCSAAINKARLTADYPFPHDATTAHLAEGSAPSTPSFSEHSTSISRVLQPAPSTTSQPSSSSELSVRAPSAAPLSSATASAAVSPAQLGSTVTANGLKRSSRRSMAATILDLPEDEKPLRMGPSSSASSHNHFLRHEERQEKGKETKDATPIFPPPAKKRNVPKRNNTGLPYPFISEEEEWDLFEKADGNVLTYARNLARILFKDSLELYYKDQEPKKREWLRTIIDLRYPSAGKLENLQKWKSISGAINKNRKATK